MLLFMLFVMLQLFSIVNLERVEDKKFWHAQAQAHLKKVLKYRQNNDKLKNSINNDRAKNIIIFIGDGMGISSTTAGRIYKGQLAGQSGEEASLVYDEFPNVGLAKTYNVDKQVPDSAGTGTALFTGVKTMYGKIGVDSLSSKTKSEGSVVTSIMDWAQAEGKRTGIVTTTRITHATPAATYAQAFNRSWECDTNFGLESRAAYKDIAVQLIEDSPGKGFNVIMGGGLGPLGNPEPDHPVFGERMRFGGSIEESCYRSDHRNLVKEWLDLDKGEGKRRFVQSRDDLLALDVSNLQHLMGIFHNNHMSYAIAKPSSKEPSLAEMTEKALQVLERTNSKGFVLMVEAGHIDLAHHENYARVALHELIELDKAVQLAVDSTNPDETLIIVTADHSHTMTISGYPHRGHDIFGYANSPGEEIYETLAYANGPGFYNHRLLMETKPEFVLISDTPPNNGTEVSPQSTALNTTNGSPEYSIINNNTKPEENRTIAGTWRYIEETSEERRANEYRHMATVPLEYETHGGEDIPVYAVGPGSHLVRGVFEQNFVAYVMSYAGCMGPGKHMNPQCQNKFVPSKKPRSSANSILATNLIILSILALLGLF